MDEDDALPTLRAKRIPREAWRQEKAVAFAHAAITCPHTIMAFDRSQARGTWSHRFESKRGLRAGTPDTLTIVRDRDRLLHIWVEWKVPGGSLNDNQSGALSILNGLGDTAKWCVTIEQFWLVLSNLLVPMSPGALVMAQRYDGMVDSRIAKAEAKTPSVKKSRATKSAPRYTVGKRFSARAKKAGIMI